MESLSNKWDRLTAQAKIGICAGTVAIAGAMIALGLWAYRPDYQVLFSDLAPRDAAAMSAELDKMKTPYQLGEGGNTILVPKDLVYKTRLKLMGKDVPLHGAVGFEVFNNADFGMTEFVQKVNYQRAVQGELTRTILSIDDVLAARVHLAIPEQGLFKKALTKPKASVTLTLKPGHVLAAEQVAGIQRLVAASVPDIVSADVTVLDQHGMALTRVAGDAASAEGAASQLDLKRSTEDYLVKKVGQLLDRTFGAGEAIASVDVALNLDQSKITTEDVLPAKTGRADASPAGVVVRDRHTVRDADSAPAGVGAARPAGGSGSTTSEADYQVGRRVEQVAVASGTIRRMTVAVVVKQALTDAQLDKLREVVALAVGLNRQRGDAIAVNSIDRLVTALAPPTAALPSPAAAPRRAEAAGEGSGARPAALVLWVLIALLCVTVAGALAALARRRRPPPRRNLDTAEREQVLASVRQWIAATPADVATAVRR